MRVFVNKWFEKFQRKERISDEKILQAVREVGNGIIDADYGHGVIKKRIARENEGKSGGYRTIILYKVDDKAFFVYGFPKKDKDNIDRKEEDAFKALADQILNMNDKDFLKAVQLGLFKEVKENG